MKSKVNNVRYVKGTMKDKAMFKYAIRGYTCTSPLNYLVSGT